ncbi:MAG: matrixin family metalloprotease [Oligoflexus sp.]
MKILSKLPLLLASMAALLTIACNGGSKKPQRTPFTPPQNVQQKFFVHGDVDTLLGDTVMNPVSPFRVDSISSDDKFHLVSLNAFQERILNSEVDAIESQEDLEDQNSTDREPANDTSIPEYNFAKGADGGINLVSDAANSLVFRFEANQAGRLELKKVFDGRSATLDVGRVLHYSLKEDGSVFSILFQYQDPVYGKSIVAIYFAKISDDKEDAFYYNTDQRFSFLLGDDIAIGWEREVNFEICGSKALAQKDMVRRSIEAWDDGRNQNSIGYLKYTITENPTPPPFSDVNHTCIYLSDSYRFEDQENTFVLGLAMPVFNFSTARIVGSSVFIATNALSRVGNDQETEATTIHEVGHVLGLGHEFKRDSYGLSLFESIMGYSGITHITSRDREAIQSLYPKVDPKLAEKTFVELTQLVSKENDPDFDYAVVSLVVNQSKDGLDEFVMELQSSTNLLACSPDFNMTLITKDASELAVADFQLLAPKLENRTGQLVTNCFNRNNNIYIKGKFEVNKLAIDEIATIRLSLKPGTIASETQSYSLYQPLRGKLNQFNGVQTAEGVKYYLDFALDNTASRFVTVDSTSQLLIFDKNQTLIQSLDFGEMIFLSPFENFSRELYLLTDDAKQANEGRFLLMYR